MGCMGGPFAVKPFTDLVISPLGVVPKKEPHKFRLIHHLSLSRGGSVNDAIDLEVCTVSYTCSSCLGSPLWKRGADSKIQY